MQTMIKEMNPSRLETMQQGFRAAFSQDPARYFSAPGRTEICGNHTDHQRGCVLAAAVNLDALAAVAENGTDTIRVQSEGYPLYQVALSQLEPQEDEKNTTASLIRGVAAKFVEMGYQLRGLDIYVSSQVLPGSGLSSSAAFEVLLGTVLNGMFCGGTVSAQVIAQIAQYAENVFFGKPSGLMDQMASSVGNLVEIDFGDVEHPVVTPLDFDFAATGYALCIIDSRASHADLTDEYAAIPVEMREVCGLFRKRSAVSGAGSRLLRESCGPAAEVRGSRGAPGLSLLSGEPPGTPGRCQALRQGDFQRFLEIIRQSGYSSYMYLQNVSPAGAVKQQDMAITLALCEHYLEGTGAYRVHGGGFAGTCPGICAGGKAGSLPGGD